MDKNKIFDKQAKLESLDGDLEFLRELTQTFLADIPKKMEKLRQAVSSQDAVTASKYAHSIKGAALTISANLFYHAAMDMEHAARNNDLQSMHACLDALEQRYAELASVLEAI